LVRVLRHRPGMVGRRADSVSYRVDFASAEANELSVDRTVVLFEELSPPPIAEFGHAFGRPHDVHEEDRGEDTIVLRGVANPRKKPFNLVEQRVAFASPRVVVDPWKLRKLCPRNIRREIPRLLDAGYALFDAVHDECWNADRRQDVADIDVHVYTQNGDGGTGTRREPVEGRRPLTVCLIRARGIDVGHRSRSTPLLFDAIDDAF